MLISTGMERDRSIIPDVAEPVRKIYVSAG
jgi:hypothetical protein